LKNQGRHDDAAQAVDQLPDKVDDEKHADLLSRFGLDSKHLLDKLPGGVGGKLGGVLGGED
jgi:hypothetical protein